MRGAAALGADLHDALVLARGRQHGLAFDDVHTDGLLAVKIRAGFDRGNHRQRMPVIRRGHFDDVQVLLLEHLAIVGVGAGLLLACLPRRHDVGRLGEHFLIDIAKRNDLHRRDLNEPEDVALAIPP
jgi:hypothetical protein